MSAVRLFIRDFYRAMGDRDVHLAAYRQVGWTLLAGTCFFGLLALIQWVEG
jgi:hypothetical protein